MRTLDRLIHFPVDRTMMRRMDADPTPEEQSLVIEFYARERFNDHDSYPPFSKLPLRFGYTFCNTKEGRWACIHEAALIWIYKNAIAA